MNRKIVIDLMCQNLFARAACAAVTSVPTLSVDQELVDALNEEMGSFDIGQEGALAKAAFELESTPEGRLAVGNGIVEALIQLLKDQKARMSSAGLDVMSKEEALAFFEEMDKKVQAAKEQMLAQKENTPSENAGEEAATVH